MFAFSTFQIQLNKKLAGTQVCPSYKHKSDLYKQSDTHQYEWIRISFKENYYIMHTVILMELFYYYLFCNP